ncbi:MAG: hypothetical protein FJ197_01260 [Gammaproteobacteria bacterium]|nr:hypothetical protein [Gammaproteobacteria bacterium]
MATLIRASYELDADTVKRLKLLARRWHVSEAEALRRVVRLGGRSRRKATSAAALSEFIAPHVGARRLPRHDS